MKPFQTNLEEKIPGPIKQKVVNPHSTRCHGHFFHHCVTVHTGFSSVKAVRHRWPRRCPGNRWVDRTKTAGEAMLANSAWHSNSHLPAAASSWRLPLTGECILAEKRNEARCLGERGAMSQHAHQVAVGLAESPWTPRICEGWRAHQWKNQGIGRMGKCCAEALDCRLHCLSRTCHTSACSGPPFRSLQSAMAWKDTSTAVAKLTEQHEQRQNQEL